MAGNEFGALIKELRKKRGMTLEEVGNIVGVSKSTVRKWETGDIANIRRDKIAALAKALGTTPQRLMGWDEEEDPTEGMEEYLELLHKDPRYRALLSGSAKLNSEALDNLVKFIDGLNPED